jgi:hypothetical protein
VLAAAVFRTTALGVATVLAVPALVAPAVRVLVGGDDTRELLDAGGALWSVVSGVSQDGTGTVSGGLHFLDQPFVLALGLSLAALVGAYTVSTLRGRRRGHRRGLGPGLRPGLRPTHRRGHRRGSRSTAVPPGRTAPLTSRKD